MAKKEKNSAREGGLNLKAFQEVLERTLETLENRVVGRLKADMATKEDLKKLKEDLNQLATKEEMRSGFQEVSKRLSNIEKPVSHMIFKQHGPKLDDHEERIQKLEIKIFSSN